MTRRPANVSLDDLRRAIKAAGEDHVVEVLPSGVIRIVPKNLAERLTNDDGEPIGLPEGVVM